MLSTCWLRGLGLFPLTTGALADETEVAGEEDRELSSVVRGEEGPLRSPSGRAEDRLELEEVELSVRIRRGGGAREEET